MSVRTRFAPSPTGNVHLGNMRVAIFNWLYARHEGGTFLLRVEDTDRERSTPEAIQAMLDAMSWLGLDFDEEPLYQTSRVDAHLEAAEQLLSKGLAYREDKGGTGQGEATIFKMPGTDMTFHDEIKGDLTKPADSMKDLVIVRSNGTPVFHLANVLDDIEMGVTHVIRGDDHIENSYRHVALYQALGAPVPKFAHLPMIVNAQGKPYSKRDGDAFVGDYRDNEYLADALFNYLALLGWSPGDDREVMTREEMVAAFSLDHVQSSPAQMDIQKLQWMNGEYMRAFPKDDLFKACLEAMKTAGVWNDSITEDYFGRVLELMGDRIKFFSDMPGQAGYFFTEDYEYVEKAVRKRLNKEGALERLGQLKERYEALEIFDKDTTEEALRKLAEELELGPGVLIHPVRVAVSGTMAGPSLFEMLELLGKEKVIQRMGKTVEKFG